MISKMHSIAQEVPCKMQNPEANLQKPHVCPYMEALQNAKTGSFFLCDKMVLVQNAEPSIYLGYVLMSLLCTEV